MIPVTSSHHFHTRTAKRSLPVLRLSSRLIGIIFLALLLMVYVAQVEQTASKQVKAQSFHAEGDNLEAANKELDLANKRAQSLHTIEEGLKTRPSDAPLVPVDKLEFLSSNSVASPATQASPH